MGKLKFSKAAAIQKVNEYNYKIITDKNLINNSTPAKILKEENLKSFCISSKYFGDILLLFKSSFLSNMIKEEELRYADLVVSITSTAVDNVAQLSSIKESNKEITKRNQLLRTLFEISKDFNALRSKKEVIKTMSLHLMGQLMISKYAILHENAGKIEILTNRFPKISNDKIIQEYYNCKTNIISYGEQFYKQVIPVNINDTSSGCVILGERSGDLAYSEDEIQFIESLVNVGLTAIENIRLLKEEIEKKQIENELNSALEIQKRLLPKEMPKLKDYDIHGVSLPSRQVGGDYFDFIPLSETELLITIMDVSGKGLPAAMIMANVQSALRLLAPMGKPIEEITQSINKLIYNNTDADKFVTAIIAILDTKNNKMRIINSGHTPTIYLGKNNQLLNSTGLLLGFMEDIKYPISQIIDIKENELIIFYTDGFNEVKDKNNEEYGLNKLTDLMILNKDKNCETIIGNAINDIKKYSAEDEQFDDLTMIALKRV